MALGGADGIGVVGEGEALFVVGSDNVLETGEGDGFAVGSEALNEVMNVGPAVGIKF